MFSTSVNLDLSKLGEMFSPWKVDCGEKIILQRNVFFNTWVLICTGENGGKSFSVENASGERTLIRAYFNILFAEFCIRSNFILIFKVEAKDFIFMVLVSIVWREKQYFLQ